MKEILSKLSTYNFFNYLLPGVIFAYILSKTTIYNIIQKDIIIGLFLYYFIGMIISRIGSLIIEPILKKLKVLKFADYKDFVVTSKEDSKIELLSEVNNMYRTLTSMLFLLVISWLYSLIENHLTKLAEYRNIIIVVFLLFVFMFSYIKQTNYVSKRVKANKKNAVIKP